MTMFVSHILLNSNPAGSQKRKINSKVFQIYGLDVMIDKDRKAWLLEINDHPSMNIYDCKEILGCDHESCEISQTDLYVKTQVMRDALKIMLRAKREHLSEIQEYRSLIRIYPSEDPVLNFIS